jgi:hypothetical protein
MKTEAGPPLIEYPNCALSQGSHTSTTSCAWVVESSGSGDGPPCILFPDVSIENSGALVRLVIMYMTQVQLRALRCAVLSDQFPLVLVPPLCPSLECLAILASYVRVGERELGDRVGEPAMAGRVRYVAADLRERP